LCVSFLLDDQPSHQLFTSFSPGAGPLGPISIILYIYHRVMGNGEMEEQD